MRNIIKSTSCLSTRPFSTSSLDHDAGVRCVHVRLEAKTEVRRARDEGSSFEGRRRPTAGGQPSPQLFPVTVLAVVCYTLPSPRSESPLSLNSS